MTPSNDQTPPGDPSHHPRNTAGPNRTPYQQRVIRNYYAHRQTLALQRAQELVTELYLSQGKKRNQHWKHLASHLETLGVKPEHIAHLMEQDDPELVAKLLRKLTR